MAKSTISKEVLNIIRKSVDEAVKKAAEAIIKANKELDASNRDYFKETERLLYSLPALKLKLAQDEEDLRNGLVSLPEKSRDIVKPSQGGYRMHDPDAREERYIISIHSPCKGRDSGVFAFLSPKRNFNPLSL